MPAVPQHPPPGEVGTSYTAVQSSLSACVRAVAKQQPGKVFPGGSTPEVCHSPVVSDLWKNLSVGSSAIADTISTLSHCLNQRLATGCSIHNFSLLRHCIFDDKCLCIPFLAPKVVCFVPTSARG